MRAVIDKYLDEWAAKRVLQSIIKKTNDVETVRWLGRPIWQYPLDAWIIQEVLGELRPDLIVETGTCLGGSAYFYGCLCDILGHGEIMSIDIAPRGTMPHPRVTFLTGSSTAPEMVDLVKQRIASLDAKRILVILDSDHSAKHVSAELEVYAPLVPVDSYIHVQDGCIDTLPEFRGGAPGPAVAAEEFLKKNPQFVRDLDLEHRYVMTAHPYGWLKRVA